MNDKYDFRSLLGVAKAAPSLARADQHGGGCAFGAPCALCAKLSLADAMVEEIDALSNAMLALDAVRALGAARLRMRTTNAIDEFREWMHAGNEESEALRRLEALADELAKGESA